MTDGEKIKKLTDELLLVVEGEHNNLITEQAFSNAWTSLLIQNLLRGYKHEQLIKQSELLRSHIKSFKNKEKHND